MTTISVNQLRKFVKEAVKKKTAHYHIGLDPSEVTDDYYKLETQRLAFSPFKSKVREAAKALNEAVMMIHRSPDLREVVTQHKLFELLIKANEMLSAFLEKVIEVQERLE